ncbi:MAG: hypothetical protein JO236_11710 [Mycobacterium sp.]|uniref:hypothetical protein n=1 Tax=Mycobacterium sp. TaxID=1785 RepID=UPI001EB0C187|nr:hypothetical protein [Mycobacterium sp.]MBW0018194.1 hypothetical protein [Mycobacterium sp.]
MKSAIVSAAVTVGPIAIAIATPAPADPAGALTVEVLKYVTPEFGVRLADLVNGAPPFDMDIKAPPDNERDMDGGQVSHFYVATPRSQPSTASAVYDVEQNGRLLGKFRIDLKLGWGGNPNNLEVSCDEQDSPIDCYAFEDPFIVRVYPKDPARSE